MRATRHEAVGAGADADAVQAVTAAEVGAASVPSLPSVACANAVSAIGNIILLQMWVLNHATLEI